MPPRPPKSNNSKKVEALNHTEDKRKNIPTAEYQSVMAAAEKSPIRVAYERRNRDLDPQLVWRGKDEQDWSDLVVSAPPLYIQEKVHPKVLVEDLVNSREWIVNRGEGQSSTKNYPLSTDSVQLDLFADFNGLPKGATGTEFYQHEANWTNRMILGDSLQVMASLAEREGLRGKVQCIYIDPPYGIRFNSNFQWSTTSRDVKDGKVDQITREPEQVKAFRDTWRDGIHSYLTYLRDRLTVARDSLTDSGSIFVQIDDENVHRVRSLMDDVFGSENFVAEITFQKTGGLVSEGIVRTLDFIIWYSKSRDLLKVRQLFWLKSAGETSLERYDLISDALGNTRSISKNERLEGYPEGTKRSQLTSLESANPTYEFEYQGKIYSQRWKTNQMGLLRLSKSSRVKLAGKTLRYLRSVEDFPVIPITDRWESMQIGTELFYVVQTATTVLQNCILMATDPGDLVLDPTCVRWGTRVLSPPKSPRGRGDFEDSPSKQGDFEDSGSLPVHGEGWGGGYSACATQLSPPKSPRRGDFEDSPSERGDFEDSGSLPVHGEGWGGGYSACATQLSPPKSPRRGDFEDSPSERGDFEDSGSLPVHGEGWGGGILVPIEDLKPGDRVYSHDGQPHRILRTIAKPYHGQMIGLKHQQSQETLWLTADHLVLAKLRPRTLGGDRDWSASPYYNLQNRKRLRQDMTPPERKLWACLQGKQLGYKFRRQHPIGHYIADFYSRDANLVVEVDGATHFTPEAIEYDQARDLHMRHLGLDILRFTTQEVETNLEGVCLAIQSHCQIRTQSIEDARWIQAGALQPGDIVFTICLPLNPPVDGGTADPAPIPAPSPWTGRAGEGATLGIGKGVTLTEVRSEYSEETVYDLEVEGAHSFVTDVCILHNCGSGTTAYVAEQWGRRWITIDTSRVALALARARIMGARYPYYILADSPEGQQKEAEIVNRGQWTVNSKENPLSTIHSSPSTPTFRDIRQGFVYDRVPHITLKAIANNTEIDVIWEKFQETLEPLRQQLNQVLSEEWIVNRDNKQLSTKNYPPFTPFEEWEILREADEKWSTSAKELHSQWWKQRIARQKEIDASIAAKADQEFLYDKPFEDKSIVRVAGPFTVESLSP